MPSAYTLNGLGNACQRKLAPRKRLNRLAPSAASRDNQGSAFGSINVISVVRNWRRSHRLAEVNRKNNALILVFRFGADCRINALFFLFTSASLWLRRQLRTTLDRKST